MALPAVVLAVFGFGPCVMPAEKLNVPAARASQTLTRIMRASSPVLMVCFERGLRQADERRIAHERVVAVIVAAERHVVARADRREHHPVDGVVDRDAAARGSTA